MALESKKNNEPLEKKKKVDSMCFTLSKSSESFKVSIYLIENQ